MSDSVNTHSFRRALLLASSVAALTLPAMVNAQERERRITPEFSENAPSVVVRDNIPISGDAPGGALDNAVNVTGVGQMRTITNLQTGTGFVCTGTLINPRTVIFAAHCVNDVPQGVYGDTTNGIPISFGFEANNLPTRRIWAGLDPVTAAPNPDTTLKFKTNVARSLYNVEQVWYDPRSLSPAGFEFLQADIAMATLDTHADGVPTWAMLFSPLTGPTHATINGYGTFGNNANPSQGLDSRRRIAENMIDFLGSLDDRDRLLFTEILGLPQDPPFGVSSNYQLDFDDPAGPVGFNFDIFPGAALTREGTTAGGDSGGPLIVDQRFAQKVVAGVLSGGTRFFGPQPFSAYGTTSFYQPLFLYWDAVVANNPYVYASAKAGNGDWFDASHWVQDMDPNYMISSGRTLSNGLPNTPALGISTETPKFGSVCINEPGFIDCESIQGTPQAAGTGPIQIAGGPGTTNFVPNNAAGNRTTGARANYYEVSLNKAGTTTLSRAATIDRLNIASGAGLTIGAGGNLTVLGDFTQIGGLTNVNGTLKTSEAFLAAGALTGNGRVDPTFLTVLAGAISPGNGSTLGSLTIVGDVVLSSAASTFIDVREVRPEKLIILGDAQNDGTILLGGTLFLTRAPDANLRAGQFIEIIRAFDGGVEDRFDSVVSSGFGSLTATARYTASNVTVQLKAGSLAANVSASNPTALAFANALDSARAAGFYDNLYGLFGAVDLMESGQLTQTLSGLMPRTTGLAQIESENQKSMVLGLVTDRLSMLGTSRVAGGSFKIVGAPETLGLANGQTQLSGSSASQMGFAQSIGSSRSYGQLPENVSGFLSGGYEYGRPGTDAAGSNGQRSTWHIAMGLEMEAASNLTIGTAFGYVNGRSNVTGTEAETRTTQATAYGSYRLSKNAYVAGLAAVTNTDIGVQRGVNAGFGALNLQGDTKAMGYDLQLETGYNLGIAKGLTLTPRAALRYSSNEIDGYRENGGELALMVDDLKDQRLEGRFGVRMSGETAIGLTGWRFAPELAVDQVQRIGGNGGDLTLRFANAAGIPIVVSGFSRDNSWTDLKGGLRMTNGKISFGGGVESSIGRSDYRDNRAVADFTLRF